MMALSALRECRQVCKLAFLGVSQRYWLESCAGARRHLLSEDVIRLQDFQQQKLASAYFTRRSKGKFIQLFREKLKEKKLLLKDELKLLLHLCQSEEDMVTAREAIYRYHVENRNMAYGEFKFGPIFVRLCYELGLEDVAVDSITDERMKGFFNDCTSFNIAMDMLFTKGSYENVQQILRTMKNQAVPFNLDTYLLAAATCYKMNTTKSFKICTSLIADGQAKGQIIPQRAYCFAVALALSQNQMEKAQVLYAQVRNKDSRLCQNLNVVIQVMSGAIMQTISQLSKALTPESHPFVRKPQFSQEVVNLLCVASEGGPRAMDVVGVVEQLEQAGQVTPLSLDDMLCYTPARKRRPAAIMERTFSPRTQRPQHSFLLYE